MTYDPFQTHSALGAFPGTTTPFQSPYSFQSPYTPLNPATAFNPLAAAYPPIAGISPQQLQLAQILAARAAVPQLLAASSWTTGLNNPWLASAVLQNPLIAAALENPLLSPLFAQTQFGLQPHQLNPYMGQTIPQFGQIGSPYGQPGSPYGQIGPMLAPQSWVGQPGLYGSHVPGQVHPLISQLVGRGFHGAGMFPTSL